MAIPKTVQRQLAEAEAIQQGLQAQAANANQDIVTDVSAMAAPAPAPAPTPAAPPPPAPAPTPAPASPPSDNWEHRFKTLQGMYNADAANFQTQLKVYQSQLANMTEQLKAVTETAKARAKEAEVAAVDPRDASEFGEDLVKMVSRYADRAFAQMREEFGTYAQTLDERVKSLEAKVNGVSGQTAQTMSQMFFDALTKAVPDWRQVNDMPKWLEWLGEEDELYGMTRQQALDDAHGKLDAKRVSAIFNKFKAEVIAKQPTLDSQVAPQSGTAAAPAPVQGSQPQLISSKAINQLYLDFAKGKYKGREQEFFQLEAQVNKAIAEGRVV